MLKIVTAPDPALSDIAKPVLKVDSSVVKIIKEMKETLNKTTNPVGVGLAAPQVGKPLRIFIAKPTDNSKIFVFINPKIMQSPEASPVKQPRKLGKKASKKLEGCLSLPNIWGPVRRTRSLILAFTDEQGIRHEQKFSNFLATIIQHENDHLNGILFPKRVLEQKGILYKSYKNEKNEDEFEEIEI
jgi:peptide deformylase